MPQRTIAGGGSFTRNNITDINANFSALFGALLQVGNTYFLQPDTLLATGAQDGTLAKPFATLQQAYDACTSGNNDVVALIGDGTTSATARLSAAFTWAKDATHLIGLSSGVTISNRSRVAPTSGATAFANFFTVSGSGCRFQNIQWFQGFGTGTTSQICMTVTGGRNLFVGCHIAGMGDDASAQSTGSRNLKISGTGENMFVDCTIGIDTVTRTVANASLELASATPRNQFIDCLFPFMTSAATVLGVLTSGSGAIDRFTHFDGCSFLNAVGSTSTTMSALATMAASAGGVLHFKDCSLLGITEFGSDATTLNQIRVMGASGTAATTGIAIIPS